MAIRARGLRMAELAVVFDAVGCPAHADLLAVQRHPHARVARRLPVGPDRLVARRTLVRRVGLRVAGHAGVHVLTEIEGDALALLDAGVAIGTVNVLGDVHGMTEHNIVDLRRHVVPARRAVRIKPDVGELLALGALFVHLLVAFETEVEVRHAGLGLFLSVFVTVEALEALVQVRGVTEHRPGRKLRTGIVCVQTASGYTDAQSQRERRAG